MTKQKPTGIALESLITWSAETAREAIHGMDGAKHLPMPAAQAAAEDTGGELAKS